MARAIDADRLADGLKLHRQPTDQKHEADRQWAVGYNAGLDRALHSIAYAPTLTQPNEPLTLEVLAKSQLLQMLGEKVEVIRMGEMCQAEWATVRSFGDCKTDSGCSCCHELYGKTWIAYRRPPEGEEKYDA